MNYIMFRGEPHPQTYYAKNGLLFTEDHIPVRKLFLSIPENLKKDMLVEYFNSYGLIISVQLFELPNRTLSRVYGRQKRKYGFVLFANANDAAIACEMMMHHVNGYTIYANVADSWHQPDLYGTSEPPTSCDQLREAYILKIPDECLSMILKLLPLPDQVHFQRVCMRFRSVYQLTARSIHKSVDLQKLKNLTHLDIREFFLISGPYVKDINCTSFVSEHVFKYFGKNCINLKSLELSRFDLSARNMFEIFSSTSKLENLKLNCKLTNEMLLALKNLKHLKKLSLGKKVSIATGKLIDSYCIRPGVLIQMCKSLTNLRELNISFLTNLAEVFKYMVKNGCCSLLETLGLSLCGQYEVLAQLPKLKRIHIYRLSYKFYITKLVEQLVLFKSDQLEELKISGDSTITKQTLMQIAKLNGLKSLTIWNASNMDDDVLSAFTNLGKLEYIDLTSCYPVNDSSVLSLVLGCPKLQEIYLCGCLQITVKLLDNIIMKIPIYYKKNERKLPIRMYLDSDKDFLTSTAQDIVKIIQN